MTVACSASSPKLRDLSFNLGLGETRGFSADRLRRGDDLQGERTRRGPHPLQLRASSALKACEWNSSEMTINYGVANETPLLTLPVAS